MRSHSIMLPILLCCTAVPLRAQYSEPSVPGVAGSAGLRATFGR